MALFAAALRLIIKRVATNLELSLYGQQLALALAPRL